MQLHDQVVSDEWRRLNTYAIARQNLAAVSSHLGQHEGAAREYEQVLWLRARWSPQTAHEAYVITGRGDDTRQKLAQELQRLGREHEAVELDASLVEVHPHSPWAWGNLGQSLECRQQDESALQAYSTAIVLAPRDSEWRLRRGRLHRRLGNVELARADLIKAIELSHLTRDGWRIRVPSYRELGYTDIALTELQSADVHPSDAGAWHLRAVMYRDLGRHREAIAAETRAIEIDPIQDDAYAGRSQSWAALGEWSAADADLRQAMELNPADLP